MCFCSKPYGALLQYCKVAINNRTELTFIFNYNNQHSCMLKYNNLAFISCFVHDLFKHTFNY